MSVTFAVESFDKVRMDIQPLLVEHYREVALYQESVLLAPDWERYERASAAGMLAVFTARKDTQLIGYSVFILTTLLHYQHTTSATNDILFLSKEHRKGLTGFKLIKFSEAELRKLKVQRILWHVKTDHDFRAMLHRLGYVDEEIVVGKLIKD